MKSILPNPVNGSQPTAALKPSSQQTEDAINVKKDISYHNMK